MATEITNVDEPDIRRSIVPETINEDEAVFQIPVRKSSVSKFSSSKNTQFYSLLFFQTSSKHDYVWRIDLGKTEKYWRGWFHGLSNNFLNCRAQKLLLLANIDRLDRDLTVGQMQG